MQLGINKEISAQVTDEKDKSLNAFCAFSAKKKYSFLANISKAF